MKDRMISKHDFLRLYHKKRLLERIFNGGKSISRLHLGAGVNRTLAVEVLEEMQDEGLVEIKAVARARWSTITPLGRMYLKEFKRFCNIIEILNNDEKG